MKHKSMTKAVMLGILVVLLALPVMAVTADDSHDVDSQQPVSFAGDGYEVNFQQINGSSMALEFTLGDYDIAEVTIDEQTFSTVEFDGGVSTTKKGFAEVPFIHASVALPPAQNVSLLVEGEDFVEYKLDHHLLPSRGVIYRDQNPDDIPYQVAGESMVDALYPENLVESTEPYIFRDIRGMNVYVYPFRYNAASKTLRVYTNVKVRLALVGDHSTAINPLTSSGARIAREMDGIYRSLFVNYDTTGTLGWSHEIGEMGEMLVIYTSRDASAIQPYIQWKREKGFQVHTNQVSTGTNVKSTIQSEYSANPGILYVQLVGDWADIKSDTTGGAPMDPMLGCVAGSDYYPELIIGRFSASNTTHVTTQVDKAIDYEKSPGGTWYDDGLGIGSGEGTGDDGEYDYEHIDVIKEYKLLPYTYSAVAEIYGSGSTSQVANAVNAGLSIINYCGHGSSTSWGTTGFSNSNVNSLTNGSKLPVIVSVACLNGTFHSGTCFAEAWLQKQNGGAVGTLMATISQPWNPPMRGQDYMNDLLTGGYDYSSNPGSGTSTTEGRTTYGSIAFNGLVLMYAESSGSSDLETIQTWTLFGDASLQVRTDTPKAIDLSNTTVYAATPFTTRVTFSGSGVEGALVSLSRGEDVFSGSTDSSGYVTINHSLSAGAAKLVVTGLNLETEYLDIVVQESGPTATPTNTPTPEPTPTYTPTPEPTATPTDTPTPGPTATPTSTPTPGAGNFEVGVSSAVGGEWETVNLVNAYTSPVVVCSMNYDNNSTPVVVRVRNVTSTSFEVKLQNPSDSSVVADDVHCVVMEGGQWQLPDGTAIEAARVTSDGTNENNSWASSSMENYTYQNSYTSPVVLGQVMSANDVDWSVFWTNDSNQKNPPSSSTCYVGKEVAEDTDTTRETETLGVIVIETSSGTVEGVNYQSFLGGDTVQGVGNSPPYSYGLSGFSSTPEVGVATQAAMDGGNGGWAVTYGSLPLSASSINLAIDEDQIGDSERSHTTEQVGVLVFQSAVSLQLTSPGPTPTPEPTPTSTPTPEFTPTPTGVPPTPTPTPVPPTPTPTSTPGGGW